MAEFTAITSQEQFDAAISSRLERERNTIRKEYADYLSPEDEAKKYAGYLSAEQVAEKYKNHVAKFVNYKPTPPLASTERGVGGDEKTAALKKLVAGMKGE